MKHATLDVTIVFAVALAALAVLVTVPVPPVESTPDGSLPSVKISDSGYMNPEWFNALVTALECKGVRRFVNGSVFTQRDGDMILQCARATRATKAK